MKYLGVDWAHEVHVAVLVDAKGRRIDTRSIANRADDVAAYFSWLQKQGGPKAVRIGIESGAALLVDQLLLLGYWVCVFNPKQAERCRDRLSASSAKDDARDAHAIAEALRTDSAGNYRAVERDTPTVEELRLVDAARTQAVERRVRAMNQLWALLQRYYPAVVEFGRPCDDPFLLALLRTFPTPDRGRKASRARITTLLERHRVRTLLPADVVKILKATHFEVAEHVARACEATTVQLIDEIELLNEHVRAFDKRLVELFDEHPDQEILESLPGLGPILSARVGARLGTRRDPDTGRARVAIRAGTAPVTRRSGERTRHGETRAGAISIRMRRGCDRVLQTALYAMAKSSLRTSPWAKACYQAHVARGASHAMALRSLSNKWAKILDALLLKGATYDEKKHVAHLKQKNVPWAADLAAPEGKAA